MAGITLLSQLHDRMTPELYGCPVAIVTQATLDIVRDFCIQTELWKVDVLCDLDAGVVDCVLELDEDLAADIRRITKLTFPPDTEATLTALYDFDGVDTITLNDSLEPIDDVTGGLKAEVILVPKINSAVWDAGMLNRWGDVIALGVKARLMDNDKERWGNPRRAQKYQQDYDNAIAQGSVEATRRFKQGSLRAKSREWL
jgi:hypothetical protein